MGNQEPLRQEETEKMQKPPQIIVIPQSMLAGQKSLLRLAPSPMPRNTSPLLSTTPPSPPSSPPTLALLQQWWGARDQLHPRHPKISSWTSRRKKKEDADEAPARKRANLDHLSP